MPELKTRIMDEDGVRRALVRIAHEIVEKNHGVEDVCLVGIRRRGVPIAESLRDNIEKIEGRRVPAGSLDITYYRDDLTRIDEMPRLQKSDLPFSIERKRVVLVDDVLYTGRTARAGKHGTVILLADIKEAYKLEQLEKHLGIHLKKVPGGPKHKKKK